VYDGFWKGNRMAATPSQPAPMGGKIFKNRKTIPAGMEPSLGLSHMFFPPSAKKFSKIEKQFPFGMEPSLGLLHMFFPPSAKNFRKSKNNSPSEGTHKPHATKFLLNF
jgi:hypothetical protein